MFCDLLGRCKSSESRHIIQSYILTYGVGIFRNNKTLTIRLSPPPPPQKNKKKKKKKQKKKNPPPPPPPKKKTKKKKVLQG